MKIYDFVVVGAGPSGSYTAFKLSKAGFKVLIIDKSEFPRDKLCGGCLSKRIERFLPQGWENLVKDEIRGGTLGYGGSSYITKFSDDTIAYIIRRREFDNFLLESARESGAEFIPACEFENFITDNDCIKVHTSKGIFFTKYLVGADGFYSKVLKSLGFKRRKYYRSVEVFIKGELSERVIIELGYVKKGYLWVFPGGEGTVSVGIASTGSENIALILRDYVERKLGVKDVRCKGWFIPFTEKADDINTGKGNILLVGDSANMTDPLLGEGIFYGLWGGELLFKSALKDFDYVQEYYRDYVNKEMVPEFVYAGKIASLAYRFKKVAFRMGRGKALERYMDLLKGTRGYKHIYRRGLIDFFLSLLG